MPSLNLILQSIDNADDKMDFIYNLRSRLQAEVDKILLFGPCNSPIAEQTAATYYYMKTKKFFPVKLCAEELDALPAVIANELYLTTRKERDFASIDCEAYLQRAFLYGTGTCELFALVGAYFLALEFDVELSIETIFSNQSHTYIRLHTEPEYILDFWSPMACEYTDNITWSEVFGTDYRRDDDATYKTELSLTSEQLIKIGE